MKLLIIDGNAIVHRAFHAYPESLTTPEGKPVNAVYGWFAMLIKVVEEVHPDYLAVCFDRPAPTFRKLLFAGYQAQRPTLADGLSEQIDMLHTALEKIGIPIFEVDGYEADDAIGTLVKQANHLCHPEPIRLAQGEGSSQEDSSHAVQNDKGELDTVVLTGDRDMLQLVNEHTKILAPITGITKFILFDQQSVLEKYGVTPQQFVDYKALVGDNSDGYPGVAGIGPKTASTLIKKYNSVENIYAHLAEISETTAAKLVTDAEQAMLAKKLATIACDVPVHLDLEKSDVKNFTQEKVIAVFDSFGFNSIKKRVGVFKEGKIPNHNDQIPKKQKIKDQLELL